MLTLTSEEELPIWKKNRVIEHTKENKSSHLATFLLRVFVCRSIQEEFDINTRPVICQHKSC